VGLVSLLTRPPRGQLQHKMKDNSQYTTEHPDRDWRLTVYVQERPVPGRYNATDRLHALFSAMTLNLGPIRSASSFKDRDCSGQAHLILHLSSHRSISPAMSVDIASRKLSSDRIPREVKAIIASYLPPQAAALAQASRAWQDVTEEHIWRSIERRRRLAVYRAATQVGALEY